MRKVNLITLSVVSFFLLAMHAFALEKNIPQNQLQLNLSFAPVVKQTASSVVNVYARKRVLQRVSPFQNDPFFNRFFGGRGFGVPKERVAQSLGSGVIVDKSGLVITNYHVIKGADEVEIALSDKREFTAEIIVTDERTDLALLRINDPAKDLVALNLGNSDQLEVGDLVLAIGNPFGVGQTVTSGIVSALARTQVGISDYQFFIQTDAAINPGNSGGALVNMQGELIGINTAIYTKSGGSNGIGFAVPINMVKQVIGAEQHGGRILRPWFGAEFAHVTSDMAKALGLDRPFGAIVTRVYKGSPADSAGIKQNDIITNINNDGIKNADEFGYKFATLGVGGYSDITLIRKKKIMNLKVELATAKDDRDREEVILTGNAPFSGATIANLTPALAIELNLDASLKAVAIIDIEQGSPAARMGFKRGDVLLQLDRYKIISTGQLKALVETPRRLWRFSYQRNGRVYKQIIGG